MDSCLKYNSIKKVMVKARKAVKGFDQRRGVAWVASNYITFVVVSWADDVKNKKSKVKLLSRVRPFAAPWTVVCQAPLSVGFPREEYCSGLPFPSPGDLPNPGIEPWYPSLQADCLTSEPPGKPGVKNKSKLFSREVVIIRARMINGWITGQWWGVGFWMNFSRYRW